MTSSPKRLILISGPARSGKSEWAEALATQTGQPVFYLATAQTNPADQEWQARLEAHQIRRPSHWLTVEVPLELSEAIYQAPESSCLLIDSLGSWLANLIELDETSWQHKAQTLLQTLAKASATVIIVSEETGWGVVPAYPMGRSFRDRLGYLVREIGAIASSVYLVTCGHVLDLGTLGTPLPRT